MANGQATSAAEDAEDEDALTDFEFSGSEAEAEAANQGKPVGEHMKEKIKKGEKKKLLLGRAGCRDKENK